MDELLPRARVPLGCCISDAPASASHTRKPLHQLRICIWTPHRLLHQKCARKYICLRCMPAAAAVAHNCYCLHCHTLGGMLSGRQLGQGPPPCCKQTAAARPALLLQAVNDDGAGTSCSHAEPIQKNQYLSCVLTCIAVLLTDLARSSVCLLQACSNHQDVITAQPSLAPNFRPNI